jgi:hypothetical protein
MAKSSSNPNPAPRSVISSHLFSKFWDAVLSPAVRFMNCLKYPQKFLFISILFALPLGLVLYFFISEVNAKTYFGQKELYGTEYLRPLKQLLHSVAESEHLMLAHGKEDKFFAKKLEQYHKNVEKDLIQLEQAEKKLGQVLETGGRFATLKEKNLCVKRRQKRVILKTSASMELFLG